MTRPPRMTDAEIKAEAARHVAEYRAVTEWPKPTWEPLWLHCGPCGHDWDGWQPSGVTIPTWAAHIRSLRCPKCGAKRKLFIRSTPLATQPDTAPEQTGDHPPAQP